MKILALGDVVGNIGCEALRKTLPRLKAEVSADMVIVNGENSADGNGILPSSAESIFASGADVITTGNHIWRRREIYSYIDEHEFLVRPGNYPVGTPGQGLCVCDLGRVKVGVINILGVVYLESLESPFETADRLIEQAKQEGCRVIVVDFHAEATAEKKALAYYLDGKVSVLFGTHTHTQTNDLTVFENGTGFITDLGMCGPVNSVLGVKKEIAVEKMKTHMPVRFENATGACILSGAVFEIDENSGKCVKYELISEKCDF